MAHLDIRGLAARYGDLQVLDGIDLQVERGEIVSLIGPSGSGKSTLLRVITGLLPPERGSVALGGQTIDYADRRSVKAARDRLAIVFQQYNLFGNMDVLRNVTVAPVTIRKRDRREVEAEARALLERVGLGDKLHAYPDQLSGGQQQRVAIARALASHPAVLLCDEPTSALDAETTRGLLDTLRDINQRLGVTIVIVSHELSVLGTLCHRVAVLQDGGIAEQFALNDTSTPRSTALGRELAYYGTEAYQTDAWKGELHA